MPFGQRPLRIHFDPDDDGAAIVDGVADRARAELLRRIAWRICSSGCDQIRRTPG